MKFNELVRTVVLPPFPPADPEGAGSEVSVRIEILKDPSEAPPFFALVWFREMFRLEPTGPLLEVPPRHVCSDVEVSYLQDSLGFERFRGATADDVLEAVLKRVAELFTGERGEPTG